MRGFEAVECDELILFPASPDPEQVDKLAAAVPRRRLIRPQPQRDHAGRMPSAKLVIGGAAATAALGVRVARSLYAPLAADCRAPTASASRRSPRTSRSRRSTLRGAPDRARAEADLRAANETFAAALVETAEADPELDEIEVHELREDLRRELERLATADIKAWRSRRERHTAARVALRLPPGSPRP